METTIQADRAGAIHVSLRSAGISCPAGHLVSRRMPQGFTLVELLVVILIVGLISILTLPTVIHSLAHRQGSEAARLLQAGLVGARDEAIHRNAPAGIRLLPDPLLITRLPNGQIDPSAILASNRMIPIETAPNYQDGSISIYDPTNYPAAIRTVNGYAGVPCLVVEESVLDANGQPNSPTSWFWNIRIGDKIQIGKVGPWYTVVGPMVTQNPELFVNVGPPGSKSPILRGTTSPEYLLLVNGRDDNRNGLVDEGFNGLDDDGNGIIDDFPEWEVESWIR